MITHGKCISQKQGSAGKISLLAHYPLCSQLTPTPTQLASSILCSVLFVSLLFFFLPHMLTLAGRSDEEGN